MDKPIKDSFPDIKVGESRFRVLGFGRYSGGDYYAYNNTNVLQLPYISWLKQGYHYSKITPQVISESKTTVSPACSWTFILKNDLGDQQSLERDWSYIKKPISLLDLLYAWHGGPMPPRPDRIRNKKYIAWEKVHGKDALKLDTERIIDIDAMVLEERLEDERDFLLDDLRHGGRLGYIMGEATMLLDLQQSEFEEVFDGSYLPCSVSYDSQAGAHLIAFKGDSNSKPVEFRGRARFLATPATIANRYRGEIRKRIGRHSTIDPEQDTSVSQQSIKKDVVGPTISEEEASIDVEVEGMASSDKIEEESDQGASVDNRTLKRKTMLKREMRYWAFIYACKIAIEEKLKEQEGGGDMHLFKTQEELIKATEDELEKIMTKEMLPMALSTRKSQITRAVDSGDLPDYKTGLLKTIASKG